MRPAPPEPDTPNEGRRKRYVPLVEQYAPEKRDKRETALLAGIGAFVGAGSVLLSQIVLSLT